MAGAFRSFRLARKVRESAVITSFYLQPTDGAAVWSAQPGQYLTLRIPDGPHSILRSYSLSGDVDAEGHHRITVKREAPPDLPEGRGSCWLHDRLDAGQDIEIAAPRGGFVLDENSQRPVLLLAGGVGVTPLLAMLHRLARGHRRVWFVQACENGAVHAMRDEVAALVAGAGGRIVARTLYRSPTASDHAEARFDVEGLVDRAFLQALLPLDRYQVYLCGPTPFMVAMYRLLSDLGVWAEDIHYEFFGKQAALPLLAAEAARLASPAASKAPAALAQLAFLTDPEARALVEPSLSRADTPRADPAPPTAEVIFARSAKSVSWTEAAHSLLDLAEAAGLAPEFSCREGICNTCRTGLAEGRVEYFDAPLQMPEPGQVLLCCARPQGRVVLDL